MTTPLPSPVVQTSLTLNEITFEIYACRELTDEEAMRAIALYIIEHRRLVKGVTYKVFSNFGEKAADAESHEPKRSGPIT